MPAAMESGALLSERLMRALTIEVRALEKASKALRARAAETGEADPAPGAKARVEAISQSARTLEKLLELQRLEALQQKTDSEDDAAETDRLRAEMLKRLRAMDARRAAGTGLFGEDARASE